MWWCNGWYPHRLTYFSFAFFYFTTHRPSTATQLHTTHTLTRSHAYPILQVVAGVWCPMLETWRLVRWVLASHVACGTRRCAMALPKSTRLASGKPSMAEARPLPCSLFPRLPLLLTSTPISLNLAWSLLSALSYWFLFALNCLLFCVNKHTTTTMKWYDTQTQIQPELAIAWTPTEGPAPTGGLNSYTYAIKLDFTYLSPSMWSFGANSLQYNECYLWSAMNVTCIVGKCCFW